MLGVTRVRQRCRYYIGAEPSMRNADAGVCTLGGRNSRNSIRPSLVVSELLVVNGPDLFSGVTSRDCIFAQHDLSSFRTMRPRNRSIITMSHPICGARLPNSSLQSLICKICFWLHPHTMPI
jgi:hypothetical protein